MIKNLNGYPNIKGLDKEVEYSEYKEFLKSKVEEANLNLLVVIPENTNRFDVIISGIRTEEQIKDTELSISNLFSDTVSIRSKRLKGNIAITMGINSLRVIVEYD